MNADRNASSRRPILILILINILVGVFVFRDYGYSWDEPLFYDYGDALGYAYSPQAWLSGHFNLDNSYGSSGDDHKTRGPAYLLLGREPVYGLEALGLDKAAAWHLVNFLFFQIGVYFLYRLARRWVKPGAAWAASALFAWQPLLWGHAFINPKDSPFLVLFLASVCLGFEMVDRLAEQVQGSPRKVSTVFFPALLLGLTTSVRVLGPLAGLLVGLYALFCLGKRLLNFIPPFVLYAVIALVAMFVTWPYLWDDPAARFVEVTRFMSDNPTNLSVLFGGQVYRAGELPHRYLPFMLAATLTEPVWPLFVIGLIAGYGTYVRQFQAGRAEQRNVPAEATWQALRSSFDPAALRNSLVSLTLILFWFASLVAYVLLRRPAMYDGLRHFLFILPPVFIFAAFAFDFLFRFIVSFWLRAGLVLLLVAPGLLGIFQLHPYEYAYYNSLVGGTSGAFRNYETDYWLTCYKQAVQALDQTVEAPANLFVHREAYIAAYYADPNFHVQDLRGALDQVKSGDYVLVNTRTNEDRKVFKDAPVVEQVTRGDATFCIVRQMP